MSGESFLQNPTAMGIAIVAILLFALLIFLLWRSNRKRREEEQRLRSELVAMEREKHVAFSADDVRYSADPLAVARDLALFFRDQLGAPVIAIYAGREGESRLARLGIEPESERQIPLPDSISSATARDYWKPQVVALSVITGEDLSGSSDEEGYQSQPLSTPDARTTSPLEEGERRQSRSENLHGAHLRMGSDRALVIYWQGPFDWNGIILAEAQAEAATDALARFREPVARLGERLAIALELKREQAERSALDEKTSRTLDFSRSLISCLEEPAPLASITREVTTLLGTDSAALWRVEPESSMVRMVAAYGLRSAEFLPLPAGQGLAGSVAQTAEPLALEDAPSDPRCIFPREARESGIGAYLGVPILFDGQAIGVVEAHTARPRKWTESDQRLLKSAASIISEILRNTEMRGKRLRVESAYLGLSEALQRLRTPGELMDAVVEVLGHALAVSRAFIVQSDDRGKPVPVEHEYDAPNVKPALGATFADNVLEEAAAFANGGPVVLSDSSQKSLMDRETVSELQVLSEMTLPIKMAGSTRAVIYLHQCDRAREWQRDEVEFADRVARQLSLSLSNVRSLDSAAQEAQVAKDFARRTSGDAQARISEVEKRMAELERLLSEARSAESQARSMLAKASAAEAKARAEADVVRHQEAEARQERDQMREAVARIEASSHQLLETNREKSEFIVNAGHEIEAPLQSVLGLAELLVQGSYGSLTREQDEAVRGIYTCARRIKSDIDLMIEYGSMRSRRLEE